MVSDVSVIIAQFGESSQTIRCVESLLQHHPLPPEILIIDDGSSRDSVSALQEQSLQHVSLLKVPRNRGVTHAWNLGAAHASGKYLIFLNNDVTTTGPWCAELIDPLRTQESLITGVDPRFERHLPKVIEERLLHQPFLSGWCFACSRDCYRNCKGFDERYRLYFSDTDFQLGLLIRTQFRECLQVVPELRLQHFGRRTTATLPERAAIWAADYQAFTRKWSHNFQ